MRQHGQIAGRFFALGMVVIAGLAGMPLLGTMSQEPPPRDSEKAAGGVPDNEPAVLPAMIR